MKAICLVLLVASAMLNIGCAATAYSAHERGQLISRNWGLEEHQMNDDIDTLFLLRPASRMTLWNVR